MAESDSFGPGRDLASPDDEIVDHLKVGREEGGRSLDELARILAPICSAQTQTVQETVRRLGFDWTPPIEGECERILVSVEVTNALPEECP